MQSSVVSSMSLQCYIMSFQLIYESTLLQALILQLFNCLPASIYIWVCPINIASLAFWLLENIILNRNGSSFYLHSIWLIHFNLLDLTAFITSGPSYSVTWKKPFVNTKTLYWLFLSFSIARRRRWGEKISFMSDFRE